MNKQASQDPCQRDEDELGTKHIVVLALELRVLARQLSRKSVTRAAEGADLIELADALGSALELLGRLAADLQTETPGTAAA